MELDVFGVDDARPGPAGHRQTVPPCPGWVGGVAEDAANAAGRQDGDRGKCAVDGFPFSVKDIGTMAGYGCVGRQGIARMVGVGDQVHRGGIGQQLNVGVFLQRADQPLHDGFSRSIPHVEDAPPRMGSFLPVLHVAVLMVIEDDARCPDQHLLEQVRSFLGQDARRPGQGCPCTGGQDVRHQQVGAVVLTAADDPALSVARIRLVRVLFTGDEDDAPLGVLRQLQRGGGSRDSRADDQYVSCFHKAIIVFTLDGSAVIRSGSFSPRPGTP